MIMIYYYNALQTHIQYKYNEGEPGLATRPQPISRSAMGLGIHLRKTLAEPPGPLGKEAELA
jgi:hypothetical protein